MKISRNVLLIGLAGMVAASMSVFALWFVLNTPPDRTQQLDVAIRMMKKGETGAPARIAESIDPKLLKRRSDVSKREFILGAHARAQAEGIQQRRIAIKENERAVEHLERSRDLNEPHEFPLGYEGLGNYYLGMALYDLFRWEDARGPLEIAADRLPQGRSDAIERLVDIDLVSTDPNPESAIERIQHWRSLPKSGPDDDDRILVKEMQALYAQGEHDTVVTLSQGISHESRLRPAAELLQGRSLFKQAIIAAPSRRDELLNQAKAAYDRVIDSARIQLSIRRLSNLELGRALRAMGKTAQAVSTFSALRLSSPYEAESLAGAVEEIDALIDMDRDADAIATLEHVTKNFGEIRWYQNDLNPLSMLRDRLVATGKRLLDKNDFYNAAAFAQFLPPICEPLDSVFLRAKTYEKWAEELRVAKRQRKPNKKTILVDKPDDSQIEKYFRIAGEAYEQLATKQLRSPEFGDLLWRSIENYRAASAFDDSNRMIGIYLQLESRENLPRGLLLQAKNYSGQNEFILAKKSLDSMILSHAKSPLIYEARLESARIHKRDEEYDQAEGLLLENLYFGDLKPDSPMWRESLIDLGELLFDRGKSHYLRAKVLQLRGDSSTTDTAAEISKELSKSYDEFLKSVARIEEGLRRFEDEPRRFRMLYKTAQAYSWAAAWPDLLLREDRILNDESIAGWTAKKRELLTQARNAYASLRREIIAAPDAAKLDPNVESHLRNSYFGEADLLYEAELYEEALTAYRDAANRFNNEPESLEALIRIASCHKNLGRSAESRRTLEMAKDVLDRIPADRDKRFAAVTRHSRSGWNDEIRWQLSNQKMQGN